MAERRTSGWASVGFWLAAAAGVPAMVFAWFWFGQTSTSPRGDRCELLPVLGTVVLSLPIVVAHALGVTALLWLALRARSSTAGAVWSASACVAAVSVIGLLVAQWFWRGELFGAAASVGFCWV
jgi:hypothetical protein